MMTDDHKTIIENDKMENPEDRIFTIPNGMSFFRIMLIPCFVWSYSGIHNTMLTAVFLILSGLTDTLDGWVARKFHMVSNVGKVLDPLADKLTQGAILLCLVMEYPLMAVPFFLLLIKEIIMCVTGLMAIKKTGRVEGADWHGKVTTFLLYFTAILHVFWHNIPQQLSTALICLCTGFMFLSMTLYTIERVRMIRGKE
ncbi:MAG: CDP-alcohol phosphatidyltransferase family protein [Lachnospiraceae bacterium]|nr:CDP-alcohol phosphatidyltransferase family protein [Lachnospiraceae bacterium]